ncbi:MAG TPA: cyclic nucleotide-binding domain-containing protein [bacterium]|nr:cyclic nucleotide-binding domain-containing protein [bacterium]HQP99888.1 cyclic nucleotide-binding domain-containing protein [bacterium]
MVSPELLQGLACLRSYNAEQVRKLAEISELKDCPAETYVYQANDAADALYLVLSGRVAVEMDLPRHRKIVVDFVEGGDFFGWSALVPPHVLTASCLCMEQSRLLRIPREPLLKLLKEDVSLKASIMEMISRLVAVRLKDTRLQMSYLLGWD